MKRRRGELLSDCYTAFMDRDYDDCIAKMVEIGKLDFRMWNAILMYSPEVLQFRQLFMICQQRLGSNAIAKLDASTYSLLNKDPKNWLYNVIKISTKEISLNKLIKLAGNETEMMQSYYYAGERATTDREWKKASELFKKSLGFNSDCIEKKFAQNRIDWLETKLIKLNNL